MQPSPSRLRCVSALPLLRSIDVSTSDLSILNALEIYDVSAFKVEDRVRKLEIAWTDDGLLAALIIDASVEAVYDFI